MDVADILLADGRTEARNGTQGMRVAPRQKGAELKMVA
jgi:hypothetical protein